MILMPRYLSSFIYLTRICTLKETNNLFKQLYSNQMKKRWKFSYRIMDKLSPNVKTAVKQLLEPDTTKRLQIHELLNGDWIAMDARLRRLCLL